MSRAQRDDEPTQHLGHLGVERGRGLVEKQDRRIVHQGARDRDLLPHPARERRELAVEDVVEPKELRELRSADVRLRDVVEPCEEGEIGAQRHPLVERWLIGDEAAASPDCVRVLPHRDPVHEDIALTRREDPADDPACRRLARPIRAEERHDLARMNLERDVVEREGALEAPGQMPYVDHSSSIRAL